MKGGLMVCGTASNVGKSHVVTGLCRLLARRGVRASPFKAQNMSLNSWVTASGHEIGRAQGIQALAAGAEPEVMMNPILLKPTGERTSQVVVLGRPTAHLDASSYQAEKARLVPVVLDSLADLRRRFDVVVCEGAGSPAEINLVSHDLVNLFVAAAAGLPAVVVGDIDRGGVFAALYGTVALLDPDRRALVRGFVINKLRGDPALLADGPAELERRTGVPTLGVLPFLHGVDLDAEDSLSLAPTRTGAAIAGAGKLDVAALRLPRVSNFTDLDVLALEPGVDLRWIEGPHELGDPDLIVIPGSKATVSDLDWLRGQRLDRAVHTAVTARSSTLLGICGGYYMLGTRIFDEVESGRGDVSGLGWLEVETVFSAEKLTRQRRGRARGQRIAGYEIRHGRPEAGPGGRPWIRLDDSYGAQDEGASSAGGSILGTSLHGLLESDGFRSAFLCEVAGRRAKAFEPSAVSFPAAREAQIDRLADVLEAHLDLVALDRLIEEGAP